MQPSVGDHVVARWHGNDAKSEKESHVAAAGEVTNVEGKGDQALVTIATAEGHDVVARAAWCSPG